LRALIVSPDYASHYLPLSALGQALAARGHEVAVATGPSLAGRVRGDGFEHHELALGPASNPGLLRASEQPAGEAARLQAFLDATRAGMIATLRVQAELRRHDLLWRPEAVTRRLREILAEARPTLVVSDQLAFGATLALSALEQPYVSFHPGHPSALPGPGELFGFPAHRPAEFAADPDELEDLRSLCAGVSARFTDTFNATLRELNPRAVPVASALSATSPLLTLLNYPAELGGHRRSLLPRTARFIGASVRRDPTPHGEPQADRALPRVYVSLGSFLSARSDVLRRIVEAFRGKPVRLVVAAGVTPPAALGDLPAGWHVASYLPQPKVLRSCDLAICHGGNNTVTEALWAGVPLLVCPFSTDQFAGAEDVRRAGLGDVFDPNHASPTEIADRAARVLAGDAPRRAAALGARLREAAGPPLATRLVERAALALRSSAPPGKPWPGRKPGARTTSEEAA
jgi:zeaxanthin glucosyltransferase